MLYKVQTNYTVNFTGNINFPIKYLETGWFFNTSLRRDALA